MIWQVCLSLCLPVTTREDYHLGWNTSEWFNFTADQPRFSTVCRLQHHESTWKGTPHNFGWKRSQICTLFNTIRQMSLLDKLIAAALYSLQQLGFTCLYCCKYNDKPHYVCNINTIALSKLPRSPGSIMRELIPCRPLSRRGWNPIKLAYKLPRWSSPLATSAFNQLGQYANSPDHRAYCYAELAVFFPSGSHNHR